MKDLLKSKKLRALLAGVAVAILGPLATKAGVPVTSEQIELVVYLLVAYIGGVGLQDMGKAKAEFEAGKAAEKNLAG